MLIGPTYGASRRRTALNGDMTRTRLPATNVDTDLALYVHAQEQHIRHAASEAIDRFR